MLSAATDRGASLPNATSAPAVVLGASPTGTSINDSPQVAVKVRVYPLDGAEFEATLTPFLSLVELSMVQPGNLVHVRYNAQNHAQIAMARALGSVEAYAPDGGSIPPLPPLLHRLIESQERDEALTQAPELPAVVVSARELGLYCAGKNPLMALVAEVRPPTGPRYSVDLTGVISQLSRHKYAEGAALFVRVSATEPSRAVISRSA
jgi:hypothetical protein